MASEEGHGRGSPPVFGQGGVGLLILFNLGSLHVEHNCNADLRSDILGRSSSTGGDWVWFMNDTTPTSVGTIAAVTGLNCQVAEVNDINANGKVDIAWRHAANEADALWLMDGTARIGRGYIDTVSDTNWKVAA